MRAVKRKYALGEAKKTDRLTEIEGLCVRHEGGL